MWLKIAKILIWTLPALLFVFLFSRYFVFSGKLEFSYDMKQDSPYIALAPSGRISDPLSDPVLSRYYRKVLAEPIYFDIRTPLPFQEAEVTLEYKNEKQESIELGGLVDAKLENYIFYPIENQTLSALDWTKIREGETVLWQREKRFDDIRSFLAGLPPKEEIVIYRYDLGEGYDSFSPLADLQESEKNYVIAWLPEIESREDGLKIQQAFIDLGSLQYGFHKYRLVFSAPRVNEGKGVALYGIHLTLRREPITWSNFWPKTKKFVENRF